MPWTSFLWWRDGGIQVLSCAVHTVATKAPFEVPVSFVKGLQRESFLKGNAVSGGKSDSEWHRVCLFVLKLSVREEKPFGGWGLLPVRGLKGPDAGALLALTTWKTSFLSWDKWCVQELGYAGGCGPGCEVTLWANKARVNVLVLTCLYDHIILGFCKVIWGFGRWGMSLCSP